MSINEKLVRIFHQSEGKYISGSELARKLGVSRTTVWNHIHDLVQQGYQFDASTNLGYRLVSVPDRILPDEIAYDLGTKWLGHEIFSYEEIESTNDLAMKLAADGAKEGTVIFAEHQRRGRGRLHRKWYSPAKKDLLFSIILRPDLHPRKVTQLTITFAVATAQTVREMYKLPALIKWPNDIIINEKKCAGILIDMSAELDTLNHVVVGIGVNVNSRRADFPKSIGSSATSLSIELGQKCDRIAFAKKLLEQLENHYDRLITEGFETISREWVDLSLSLGRRVEATSENETIVGIPVRLDDDGALLIRTDTGIVRKVSGGDLTVH